MMDLNNFAERFRSTRDLNFSSSFRIVTVKHGESWRVYVQYERTNLLDKHNLNKEEVQELIGQIIEEIENAR